MAGPPTTPAIPFIEGLILVSAANSVLQVVVQTGGAHTLTGSYQLIVQQSQ
jgi:hypothetical protein